MCRKVNLRTLLFAGLSLATVADAAYLLYSSYRHAQAIEGFNGFCYTLAELAILDLAIRATPAASEGFVFSLMMSVRNFALFGTDWFGSALIDRVHWSFNSVVLADALTTCLTIPLVLFLPVILVRRRDDQSSQPSLAVALQQP
jgi:predicted MFS family arabinose efflux permease